MNPLLFRWEGDAFKPIPRHAKDCDARYVIGEHYALEEIKNRSSKSHAQFFASINDAWLNLPEAIAEKFATAEHLRKHALIASGYFDKRSIQTASKAEALRLAAFIRPMDEYAIVTVNAALVEVYTAKSQSYKAMGKKEFQESKTAVLDYVAGMIGTTARALNEQTVPTS